MIQSIEIIIRSGLHITTQALIKYPKNIMYLNNKKYKVPDSFLKEVTRTICLWDNEYGNDNNIDTEEFIITVESTDGQETFHGKGHYPHNYLYLKELLGDVHD